MITKIRIRSIDNYLIGIPNNEAFYIGVEIGEIEQDRLKRIGLPEELCEGEMFLPSIIGPRSRFNSDGSYIRDKTKPMEIRHRQAVVTDWHGYDHLVMIPYKRYPRIPIPAPNVELTIVQLDEKWLLISPLLNRDEAKADYNKHVVNLFLELFGHCSVLKRDLAPALVDIPVKRVNWLILPKGEYPWDKTAEILKEFTGNKGKGIKRVIEHRVKTISEYRPSNIIIGRGGFRGYWIFEFEDKSLYLLESLYYGDATYILGSDWEKISQLTKSEIINNNLHKGRYVHTEGWEKTVDNILR